MKRITMVLAVLAVASIGYAAEHQHGAPAPTSPAFEKMKSLVGTWKADVPGMGESVATYTLHSDGSALVENLSTHGEDMITVYYPTADGVAMTHYCSSHNQPHMVAKGAGADKVSFSEVSVDNLPSKDAMHMDGVDFAFTDANHFTATWKMAAGGSESPVPFNFTRVK